MNKGRPYRTSAGIPFILRFPEKVRQGKRIQSAFSSIDFAPSILSLMGVKDHGIQFDGIDFSKEVSRSALITNYPRSRFIYDSSDDSNWIAVIRRNLKLVLSRNGIPWLFDLTTDPFETINYFGKPKYAISQAALLDDIFKIFDEKTIPSFKRTKIIYWSKPACLDSKDRIIIDSKSYTCDHIGTSLQPSKCNEKQLQNHCPVTCNSCCKDSVGKIWVDGVLRMCNELKPMCRKKKKIQRFCPQTCEMCSS